VPSFEVKEIPGKGRGLVATRTIEVGELLLDEVPIVTGLSPVGSRLSALLCSIFGLLLWTFLLILRYKSGTLDTDLALLRGICLFFLYQFVSFRVSGMIVEGFTVFGRVRSLPQPEREAFYNLRCNLGFYVPVLSEALIFRSNAVSNDMGGCVCPVTAMINHACLPTALFAWDEERGHHEVRALREIKAGEEIATSYVDLWQPTVARQHFLRNAMRFTCACETCLESTEESVRRMSDHRRSAGSGLERGIPDKLQAGNLEEAIKDLQALKELTILELGGRNLISDEMDMTLKELEAQLSKQKNSKSSSEMPSKEATEAEKPSSSNENCEKKGDDSELEPSSSTCKQRPAAAKAAAGSADED